MQIKALHALEVLDSRGNPTVECTAELSDGSVGVAMVPSGASTGVHEALELRDNDPARFMGQGVLKAVQNVSEISALLAGSDAADQKAIDQKMLDSDGTPDKSRLGANAILAVSLSVAKAESVAEKLPLYKYLTRFDPQFNGEYLLPVPLLNIINGGKHANWSTDIQEFMILPLFETSFRETLRAGAEIYHQLQSNLKTAGLAVTVGDEGGFAPQFKGNAEPFEYLLQAISDCGFVPGQNVGIGIDAAASEFFKDGVYNLKKDNLSLSSLDMGSFWNNLSQKYPIVTMEDVFDQDDWDGYTAFQSQINNHFQIVGDDLYVTNIERLKKGIDLKATNSILIKLNQIGSLTETISAILMAKAAGMTAIVSHRSGETEDTFIADLVVGLGTGQIKSGAPCRSERTAKYNRLLEIENELGKNCHMAVFPYK